MKTKLDLKMAQGLSGLGYFDRPEALYGIDLLDSTVLKAAKFAVEDHNLKMKTNYKLMGIEKGASMVVGAGIIIFYLILTVQVRDEEDEYDNPLKVFITAVLVVRSNDCMDSIGLQEYTSPLEPENAKPYHRQIYPPIVIETAAQFALKYAHWELVDVVDWDVAKTDNYDVFSINLLAHHQQNYGVFETEATKNIDLSDDNNNMHSTFLRRVFKAPKIAKSLVVDLISPLKKFIGEFLVKEHNRNGKDGLLQGTELEFVDCIFMECDVDDAGLKYSITLQAIDGDIHKIFTAEVMTINSSSSLGSKTELNISDVLDDIEDQRWVSTDMDKSRIEDVEEPNSIVSTGLNYVSEAAPKPKAQVVLPYASPDWISSQFLINANRLILL